MMSSTSAFSCPTVWPVALTPCTSYQRPLVEAAVRLVLAHTVFGPSSSGWRLARGNTVLVKPNLLRAHALSCTHAEVVRALCLVLQEEGLRVCVADSPGFGSAQGVARSVGLDRALRPLGLEVMPLGHPRPVLLRRGRNKGGQWGVARQALECDAIISVPKVKAHCQMRASLAVKNLFGCVCGLRKAIAHTAQGHCVEDFALSLLDLWQALPPVAAVADGIVAMHVTGPSGGRPFALGCLGASASAMALDTALYRMLGVEPQTMPLWGAAQGQPQPLSGACVEDVCYPLCTPETLAPVGFVLPEVLTDISFQPHRLLLSLLRRLWSGWQV